jgi:hypothetical protein
MRERCLRNRFELGQIMAFGSGRGPAMCVLFFGSGTNSVKDRSSGNLRYTVVAGKAKWRFRLISL